MDSWYLGFQGALPEPQVREFVERTGQGRLAGRYSAVRSPRCPRLTTRQRQPSVPVDPRFSDAEAALEAGQFDLGREALPGHPRRRSRPTPRRRSRCARCGCWSDCRDIDPKLVARAETAPDDVPAQLAAADYALSRSDVDGALGRLLALVRRVSGDDRDAVREAAHRVLCDLLGPDDPRVPPARRRSRTPCS